MMKALKTELLAEFESKLAAALTQAVKKEPEVTKTTTKTTITATTMTLSDSRKIVTRNEMKHKMSGTVMQDGNSGTSQRNIGFDYGATLSNPNGK